MPGKKTDKGNNEGVQRDHLRISLCAVAPLGEGVLTNTGSAIGDFFIDVKYGLKQFLIF